MREFIGDFSSFFVIQNVLVVEFYGVIHAIKEAKKWVFHVSNLNVIMS